jgi:hypothetical protein
LLLSGRSIVETLWDVPATTKDVSGKGPAGPSVAWPRVARALLTRPFRFLLPVLVVAGLQWGLAATGKTGNSNAVGMDEPHWAQISSFAGYATLIFDLVRFLAAIRCPINALSSSPGLNWIPRLEWPLALIFG